MSTVRVDNITGQSQPLPAIDGLVQREGFLVGAGQTEFTSTLFDENSSVRGFLKDAVTSEYSEVVVTFQPATQIFEIDVAPSENDQIMVYGIDDGLKTELDPFIAQLEIDFDDLIDTVNLQIQRVDEIDNKVPDILPSDKGKVIAVDQNGTGFALRNPGVPLGTTMNINAPVNTIGDNWVPTNGGTVAIGNYPDIDGLGILTSSDILEYNDGYFEQTSSRPIIVGDNIIWMGGYDSSSRIFGVTVYDTLTGNMYIPKNQPYDSNFDPSTDTNGGAKARIVYDGTNYITMCPRANGVIAIRYSSDLGQTAWNEVEFNTGTSINTWGEMKLVNGQLFIWSVSGYFVVASDYTDVNTYSYQSPSVLVGGFTITDILWTGSNYVITTIKSFFQSEAVIAFSATPTGTWQASNYLGGTTPDLIGLFTQGTSGTVYAYSSALGVYLSSDHGETFDYQEQMKDIVTSSALSGEDTSRGIVQFGNDAVAIVSPSEFYLSNNGINFFVDTWVSGSTKARRTGTNISAPYKASHIDSSSENRFVIDYMDIDVSNVQNNTSGTSDTYLNIRVHDFSGDTLWATRNLSSNQFFTPDNSVSISTDGGETWTEVTNPSVQFGDPQIQIGRIKNVIDDTIVVLYSKGESPILYKTANTGASWSKYTFSGIGNITDVDYSDVSGIIVSVVDEGNTTGRLMQSTDDGATFTTITTDAGGQNSNSITYIPNESVRVSGSNIAGFSSKTKGPIITYSVNGGGSFVQHQIADLEFIHDVAWFDGFLWVVGSDVDATNFMMYRLPGGGSWEDVSSFIGLDASTKKAFKTNDAGDRLYLTTADRIFYIESGQTGFSESSYTNQIKFAKYTATVDVAEKPITVLQSTTDVYITNNTISEEGFLSNGDHYYLAKLIGTGQYVLPNKTYNGDPTYIKLGWYPSNGGVSP